MTSSLQKAGLYLRTVAGLRPTQPLHRIRLRGQRAVLARIPERHVRAVVQARPRQGGWPDAFAPLDALVEDGFPGAAENAEGRFRFIEESRSLGHPPDWMQATASQLWRYHLHYFEWAWAFARDRDRLWAREAFASLWRSWRSSIGVGRSDAWSPYVASVRAWSWCGVHGALVAGSAIEGDFYDDLALHAAFVRAHLEHDVGGNHLVKNLKALIGCGVFLDHDRLVERGCVGLERQLPVQVLADGGHFERSPSYHCQVLGDLIDVDCLLTASGRRAISGLREAIDVMRGWLGAVLLPDGDVPLFNDCTLVGTRRLELLQPSTPSTQPLRVLQPSGYIVIRGGERVQLVADVGPPCPPDLPAHAHADCLSFELTVDGRRIIVNTGTSTYARGDRRQYERSTAAHNTVQIDGRDQTEVWGTFRAARRAQPRVEHVAVDGGTAEVTASHDGYARLPGRPRHRRTWRLGADVLEIVDEVTGNGDHRVDLRVHVAPGVEVRRCDERTFMVDGCRLAFEGPVTRAEATGTALATGFGSLSDGTVIAVGTEGSLPILLRTTITCAL